jgi:uncharacterized membrane protein YphA (DoxX/SURF4 family)
MTDAAASSPRMPAGVDAGRGAPDPAVRGLALAFALGLAALGAMGVASRDFAFQWQPVPPGLPARAALALVFGVAEIAAAAWLVAQSARPRGFAPAALVAVLWLAMHLPAVAGARASLADWLGVAESGALALGLALWALQARDALVRIGFVAYGAAALVFGASHVAYADFTASMIPAWLPARHALALLTGAGHAAAGLAIATGVLRRVGAWCEAAMMAVFVALVHLPRVAAQPGSRLEWTMLCVAVMLAASAGLVAALQGRRQRHAA